MTAAGGGCAADLPPTRSPAAPGQSPTRVELVGDWDDAQAAVKVGLGQTGIAAVHLDASDPAHLVYTLRTPWDEPGVLHVERLAPPQAPDPVQIGITCTIGRFGDAQLEQDLLRRVERRLEDLRGVEVAPIRR